MFTSTSTSITLSSMPKISSFASRSRTAAIEPPISRCSRPCGSATRGAGGATTVVPASPCFAKIRSSPNTGTSGATRSTAGTPAICFLRRTRRTPNASSAPFLGRRTSRTPFTPTSSTSSRTRSIRRACGTKAAALYQRSIPAGGSATIVLRMTKLGGEPLADPFLEVETIFAQRKDEADEFYAAVIPDTLSDDAKNRRARPGLCRAAMVEAILPLHRRGMARRRSLAAGTSGATFERPEPRVEARLLPRCHRNAGHVGVPVVRFVGSCFPRHHLGSYVDPIFAKRQIILRFREWYSNEDGEVPAYEWSFNDVNPPVLSMAALRVFRLDRDRNGTADYAFLEEVFHKLLISFTWWANRKDALGNDIFQGGFLGLDNIGPFDRNALPPGYPAPDEVDGTAWMAAFSQEPLRNRVDASSGQGSPPTKASRCDEVLGALLLDLPNAMNNPIDKSSSLWDEEDGFFYDMLFYPDGHSEPIRARTLVGFVPLLESVPVPANAFDRFPGFKRRREWFMEHRPKLFENTGIRSALTIDQPVLLSLIPEPISYAASSPTCWTRASFSRRTASARSHATTKRTHLSSILTAPRRAWTTNPENRRRNRSAGTRIGAVRFGCR